MASGPTTVSGDMTIRRGATFRRRITWTDRQGNPRDLTGYTATLIMRPHYSDEPTLKLTSADGEGITLGDGGVIDIKISANITADLPVGQFYIYDLRVGPSNLTSERDILVSAKAKVLPSASAP